jgi:hypothetical protein
MSGYYAVLLNVETGASACIGPLSWNVASGTAALAERREDIVDGVVGRRDGGQA